MPKSYIGENDIFWVDSFGYSHIEDEIRFSSLLQPKVQFKLDKDPKVRSETTREKATENSSVYGHMQEHSEKKSSKPYIPRNQQIGLQELKTILQ